MKVKIQVFALILVFSLLASGTTTLARTWTPGVVGGDYFYFEMYGVYSSNRSNITIAIPQFECNTTDWTRINITDVSGSSVYQVFTLHFKNGSESTFTFKNDVNPENESSLKFPEKAVPICAANLSAGELIPTVKIILNETITRTYSSGPRQTNHAAWNSSDDWGNIYFDRETGMLVELCRTHRFTNSNTGEIVEKTHVIKLTITNRWEITTPSSPLSLSFVFLTVTICALLCFIILTHKLVTKKTRQPLQR